MGRIRARFWAESVLGGLSALLCALTLVSREWIEVVFGVDPDHGDGTLEWLIVVVLAVAGLAAGILARAEWRRAQSNT